MRAVLFAAALLHAGASFADAALPSGAPSSDGRSHYLKGVELYDHGRFAEARAEFDTAFRATHDLALLFDVGQCDRGIARGAAWQIEKLRPLSTGTAPAGLETAPPIDREQRARVHFREGVRRYDAGQYAAAIPELEAAYRIHPAPAILFDVGQCYKQLGDKEQAIALFRVFLRESPPDARVRGDVAALIEGLGGAP